MSERTTEAAPRFDLLDLVVRYGLVAAFGLMCLFLAATRDLFATGGNIRTILLTSAVSLIIAIPLGMLLQSGGIDFSVGSTLGLCVVLGGRFMSDYGWNPLVASTAVLACAAFIGFINGQLCARWKLSPVVVTIGMLFLLRGLAFVLSGAEVRRGFGRAFSYLGRSRWVVFDIPAPVVLAFVWGTVLLTLWYRTRWGRHAHAAGIDDDAAVAAGIDTARAQHGIYVLTSIAAGLGSLVLLSRLDSAPPVTGNNLELELLTAILLAGVAFSGGFGSVANVVIGVLFLSVLGNGLIQYGVDPNWTRVVEGAVLVGSAGFQVLIVKAASRQRFEPATDRATLATGSAPDGSTSGSVQTDGAPAIERTTLAVKGLSKNFGPIAALDDVSFSVRGGEVLALLGDNGAGKSTLVKALTGIHQPSSGAIVIDGQEHTPASPSEAQALGIEAVQQGLGVVGLFSASQNLFLGREPTSGPLRSIGWIDRDAMRSQTLAELERLHVRIRNIDAPVASMSGGQRQSVAVARASLWATSVVLLDEPTAALGVEQSAEVLRLVRRLADAGSAVLLVTHDMPQVVEVCDRAVVLRRGRLVADEWVTADTTVSHLVGLITGSSEGRFDA